jgi:hypothetical protein
MWSKSVWASGPNDVFVVGGAGDGSILHMVHFNGATWDDWSDRVRPFMSYAFGVWGTGPNNVYVLGSDSTGGGRLARFDGATWSAVDTEVPIPSSSIWGSSASDIFVVGGDNTIGSGSIVHFDGTRWSPMLVPAGFTQRTTGVYNIVTGTGPTNVFASSGRTVLRFDGTAWYPVRRPVFDSIGYLQVVLGQLWLAGPGGIGLRLVGLSTP